MLLIGKTIQRLVSSQLLPNPSTAIITSGAGINVTQIRTKVIYHLPKPTEVRRVRKQGYLTRVKTPIGRRYMMERILKGDKIVAQ